MHDNQLDISPDVVRTLVERQFPLWRSLPVRHVTATGTVNAIFRIGGLYAARFPLEAGDVDVVRRSLETEAKAAAELAGRTRFQTPEPIALGEPGAGYPLPWSVQTWLPGTVATDADPADSAPFALDLAEFIVGVRLIPALGRTFSGPGRGGDLHDHDEWLETCFVRSAGLLDVNRLRRMWGKLRDLPRGDAADVMSHGDLMPGNVLVSGARRRLAGVLDVGGLRAADPSLDLVSAWHLLEAGPRKALREALGSDDLEWARGKAWAFQQSMGLVWYYADSNPVMAGIGRRTLDRLIADERPLPAPGLPSAPLLPTGGVAHQGRQGSGSFPASVKSASVKPRLAGRQPSSARGAPGEDAARSRLGRASVDPHRSGPEQCGRPRMSILAVQPSLASTPAASRSPGTSSTPRTGPACWSGGATGSRRPGRTWPAAVRSARCGWAGPSGRVRPPGTRPGPRT
jgi:aminoglycoside phosphotransferase (APT) family kinase protein